MNFVKISTFLNYFFSKRRARGSNLEASVMALKTTTYTRSRHRVQGSIYALAFMRGAQLNHLLWSARGSTLEPVRFTNCQDFPFGLRPCALRNT